MLDWFAGFKSTRGSDAIAALSIVPRSLAVSRAITAVRQRVVERVREVNVTTEQEVTHAARYVSVVVDRARQYVNESQTVFGSFDSSAQDGVGALLGALSSLVRSHVKDMSARAVAQDERARRAAMHAKNISDLAASIDRLASEARLLAVNARIESSRLGAHSAGFEVLATEMQRLSDEVASTNEQVEDLAARLGNDLPAIAMHAQQLRTSMDEFASAAKHQIEETDRGVGMLHSKITVASRQGEAVMEAILGASHAALSHLQFQDVVAQQLRQADSWLRDTQLEVVREIDADATTLNAVPPPEYSTEGERETGPQIAASGEVTLF